MKSRCFRQCRLWPFVVVTLLAFPLTAAAQGRRQSVKFVSAVEPPSPTQQIAIESLESLARTLKSEADRPAAAALQARIADTLWKFAEPSAREIFAWAFDAARTPVPDEMTDAKRTDYVRRQAVALCEVLRRMGRHDSRQAETWLKELEKERAAEEQATRSRPAERAEMLVQLALELAPTNSEQATDLGLHAISGPVIPESFGRLLFSLGNIDRSRSDALFRGALAALRRNGTVYDSVLITLTNYLFNANGELHSETAQSDAQLFIRHLFDAADAARTRWRLARDAGARVVSDEDARLYGLLAVRFLPIVSRYAAERLPQIQAGMGEMASGLSQEQARHVETLSASRQQQAAVSGSNRQGIDEQIERAEKERDPQVRDALLGSVAYSLMRQDAERALAVAAKIGDNELRVQAEDDINLARLQGLFNSLSYDEGRKLALRFSNTGLKARMLAELAGLALSKGKDAGLAGEMLSEAHTIAMKSDPWADKPLALLFIAQQFARFDAGRAFDVLADAVKAVNQLKKEEEPRARASTGKARPLRFKSYTVINGSELAADERATIDSIDFNQIAPLAAQNYLQTRSFGERIDNPLLRVKFLIATASGVLSSTRQNIP